MEYETDEEILHFDDASESSDEELSEQDDEISFDEHEPALIDSPPAPVALDELCSPPPPPAAISSDGTTWYTDPPSVNGKCSAFFITRIR